MVEFGRLTDVINNAGRLDVFQAVRFGMEKPQTKALVIHLNTRRQLYTQGVDALGVQLSEIGGNYTLFTLRSKQGRPDNRADRIDLFDTGDFYRSFEVITGPVDFEIKADTVKDGEDLRGRWGPHIIGLTIESQELLMEFITPDIQEWILDTLLK